MVCGGQSGEVCRSSSSRPNPFFFRFTHIHHERSIFNFELVINKRNILHCLKRLDRNESNFRNSSCYSNRYHHLHPCLHRQWGNGNAIDYGDGFFSNTSSSINNRTRNNLLRSECFLLR